MSDAKVSFSGGIARINNLNASSQTITTGTSGTDFNISSSLSTHTFNIPTASATNRGLLSSADWTNFNTAYTNRITSLTTTGSSGSATLIANVLNIPTYTLSGLGGVPTSRTITINGNTQDLSADRSWTIVTVVNWTEAFNSGTQATSSWTPSNAAANVNAAIRPKGTGALIAAIPDGTATGGNARGQYVVDLQMIRSAATQVASADYTTILGGRNNTVRSSDSTLVGGNGNIIWNHRFNGHSTIVGGQGNRVGNADSSTDGWNFIGGGVNNSALCLDSCVIVGGNSNIVGGFRSSVVGGASNNLQGNTQSCFIGGGESNVISASVIANQKGMVIVGGFSNTNSSQYGFIGAGQTNSNTSNQWSSIVGGLSNSITNNYAFIGGGQSNTASGQWSTVGGGQNNTASGSNWATVGGGFGNSASANGNVVAGGYANGCAGGGYSAICGGEANSLGSQFYGFIGGGRSNSNGASNAVIGGGETNSISTQSTWGTIGGGQSNALFNSNYSAILGGRQNSINPGAGNSNEYNVISGGYLNSANANGGSYVFIGGGSNNQATGAYSVVCGGGDAVTAANRNVANGNYCTVVGGLKNTISSDNLPSEPSVYSFIGGGQNNQILRGSWNTIAGGYGNYILAIPSIGRNANFIGGGYGNSAYGAASSVVCGGESNGATYGRYSFIGGGTGNSMSDEPYVTICGGQSNSSNTGSQGYIFIGGGRLNSVTKTHTVIAGGRENLASGEYSAILGGYTNTSSGDFSTVGGGYINTASGTLSTVTGGYQGTANLYGQQAHASGRFSANGDAQAHELIWRRVITGSPVGGAELFLDGGSVAAILPGTNSIWHGVIDVAAICTSTGNGTTIVGDVEATSYKVTIKRIGTNTVLVGTVQEIGTTNADPSMVSGLFTIDNNNTNESLRIFYTSPTTAGSTTVIRVVATFRGLQIQY